MKRGIRPKWMLVALLICCLVPLSMVGAQAQDVIEIGYGSAAVNNLPTTDSAVIYTFNGTLGDLVTIRAVGVSVGSDPRLSLASPAQSLLATNDNTISIPTTTAAQIVFRLQETGMHYIVVNGTPGDFLLTLDSRPAVPLTVLDLDTPLSITFPLANPSQAYVFNTDPFYATSLLIDATPYSVDAYVELRDGTGEIISALRSNLDSTCISVGAGDQLLELSIVAAPEVAGTINLTLSNAPCTLGTVPVEIPPTATPQFTPSVVEGLCVASSSRNVNLRSGPGTNYARLALLQARQTIQVIGQSENGQWFTVQNDTTQGWVSAAVVTVTGPCAQLPVVVAPPLPVATATPGFPVIIVQPGVVTATPIGAIIVTATPFPVTPPVTLPPPPPTGTLPPPPPTAVVLPTLTPTATITVTPGA
ncbi:MAG: SH3 domain-containing protein [Chloroflexi bacterium]|nr:SH3 domain-containing protein [Chloroflexota bacterium]